MSVKVTKENIDLLLGYNQKLTRDQISQILGLPEGHARVYKGIVDNYSVITKESLKPSVDMSERRVLVVPDLHAPFVLDGFLDFCISIGKKYQCTDTVFIGDISDFHASSFHESDVDGDSAGDELSKAEIEIAKWYGAFPVAKVCIGNHDLIPLRKAQMMQVSSKWIKSLSEIFNTPNWTYAEDFTIDGVMYTHGVGRQASQRAKNDMISIVQGHWHSKSYIDHFVGLSDHIWAMQVGCGVDRKSYAMAYGKHFDKPHINCGVVLENGTLPVLEYMNL